MSRLGESAGDRFAVGVCSWSMQVDSVPDLVKRTREVGADVVQIGLGDPNHGTWREGAEFLKALADSSLVLTGTMIGYPGEDYTSPQTIRETGGFGDPGTRGVRLGIFRTAVEQTARLGLRVLCSHAGFIPDVGAAGRDEFLDCLRTAAEFAAQHDVVFAMETGQETAELLRVTLDEIDSRALRVNFDPANMILYDMGDPIEAIEVLGPDIAHVHAKDAVPPRERGAWGTELPLGEGDVGMERFVNALARVGYDGPLCVEREVGTPAERVRDIAAGIRILRTLVGRGSSAS